jgi:glyoxylase-like metal-dependent hydrolase (beta-lactamase superfamily II)
LHTKEIGKNLFMVELETGGFKNLICSYVIKGKTPFLVESGPTNSIPNLLSGLHELGIAFEDVEYVVVTHVHLDHGGGAGTLLHYLPNAKVIVHPRGMPHLVNPERLWHSSQKVLGFVSEIFGKPEPVPEDRIVPMTEGTFDLGVGGKLTVVETPGHASHNLSFHESFNNGVFPGDAAGTYNPEFNVVVPTTPPPFYLEPALASLDKLISLNPTALYFSHFGKVADAVRRLKDHKAQLQLWAKIALEGVKNKLSMQEICNRILKVDKVMAPLEGYLRSHPVYAITVLDNDMQGFIGYAQRTLAQTPKT